MKLELKTEVYSNSQPTQEDPQCRTGVLKAKAFPLQDSKAIIT